MSEVDNTLGFLLGIWIGVKEIVKQIETITTGGSKKRSLKKNKKHHKSTKKHKRTKQRRHKGKNKTLRK